MKDWKKRQMPDQPKSPEFSRVKTVAELAGGANNLRLEADDAERAALAKRFGLVSLDAFSVIWSSRAWRRDGVTLTGRMTADYVQSCVVTLKPISVHLDEAIEFNCLPESSIEQLEEDGELIVVFEEEDAPEPIVDGRVDLGELASQTLATAIDPYPKSADAGQANLDAQSPVNGAGGENPAPSEDRLKPFAALEKLKNRPD